MRARVCARAVVAAGCRCCEAGERGEQARHKHSSAAGASPATEPGPRAGAARISSPAPQPTARAPAAVSRTFPSNYLRSEPVSPAQLRPAAVGLTSSSCGPPGIPDEQDESSPAPSSSRPRSLPGSSSVVSPLKTGGGDSALLNAAILNCEKVSGK